MFNKIDLLSPAEDFREEGGRMPFEFTDLEVRSSQGGGEKLIRGHGAVYGKLSEDLGGFRELFEPGSLADTIKNDDIRSLRDHNSSYILGRTKAGTLSLREDTKGIYYEVTPPDTSYARDLMVSIERRDVTGGSIIFRVDGKDGERWFVDGEEVDIGDAFMAMWDEKKHKIERHVVKGRLWDIGPVTFPAYPQTDVKVRSLLAAAREKLHLRAEEQPVRPGLAAGIISDLPQEQVGADAGRAAAELARQKLEYGYPK